MKRKNIFVSPLDWGIGHASRCVSVINELSNYKVNIYIGASGRAASFLKNEFPDLEHIPLEGYNIRYPESGRMAMAMLRQTPGIMASIRREHKALDNIIAKYGIDIVISDNRFGLWSRKAYSIYLTHQLSIKGGKWKIAEGLLRRMHANYINKFDECWVPDLADAPGLAGELSHGVSVKNLFYIGPQSRFAPKVSPLPAEKYDIMAIISGPEPQRRIFEKMVIKELQDSDLRSLVVLGKPEAGSQLVSQQGNMKVYSHLPTNEMREAMLSSSLIVCRPGYSSIMDLAVLGLQAAFVPTPGQTEQEYLAHMHKQHGHYFFLEQDDFQVTTLIRAAKDYHGIKTPVGQKWLAKRIKHLMEVD